MLRQKMRTFVALMLALLLLVSMNVSAYSNDIDLSNGNATTADQGNGDLPVIEDDLNSDGNQTPEESAPVDKDGNEQQEQDTEQETAPMSLVSANVPGMTIESVEIKNAGATQIKYRQDMFEDGGKYFTEFRDASMLDPRIFTVKATFSSDDFTGIGTGDGEFDVNKVSWWYGDGLDTVTDSNKPIAGTDGWTKVHMGNTENSDPTRTQNPIVVQGTPVVEDNGDGTYSLTAEILFDVCYPTTNDSSEINVPYTPYAVWQRSGFDVLYKLLDSFMNATLRAVYNNNAAQPLASTKLRYNIRDYYYTWKEFDDYIRDTVLPGSNNAGDGSYAKSGRYLSVQSLGKSNGYNDGKELDGGAPVKREIWNAVLSDKKDSIDYYQNVIQPKMMTDPTSLNPNDPNFRMPIYFNNIHANETPGMDAVIKLMKALAIQDKVSYKTTVDSNTQHVEKQIEVKNGTTYYLFGYTTLKDFSAVNDTELDVDQLLKKFIFVFTFCENPDGRYYGSRINAYGFDPNRDSAYQTQIESQYTKADIAKWDPLAMLEFHGFYKQLLLEPCTPPHDPNLEYDLIQGPMLKLVHQYAKAAITEGAFNRYSVVVDDYNSASGAFDDGSAMYSPIYALHYGTLGYTYETPTGNIEDVLMMEKASYAMLGELMTNYNEYVANKLEYKRRGVANEDKANLVDSYFKDYEGNVVGRPREEGKSFFPEYYIIPVDNANQYNTLEAYNMVKYLTRNQVMVEKTTQSVTVDGKTYPAGTYVVDMHQGNRDIANTVLSPGFDASTFKTSPYAELIMSFPALRGLDAVPLHTANVFKGKTTAANYNSNKIIVKESEIKFPKAVVTGTGRMVIVKNNNQDVIKLVIKALKDNKNVYMLSDNVETIGVKGDFYMSKADFDTYSQGLYAEAKATSFLAPETYKSVKMPKFRVYGSANESAFVFEKLGFVRNEDFFYVDNAQVNSVVTFNNNTNVSDKLNAGLGLVAIGKDPVKTAATNNYLGSGLTFTDRSTGTGGNSRFEALVKGTYSDDSMVTPHYNRMKTMYSVNSFYINAVPATAQVLMQVDADNSTQNDADYDSFFIAGWSYDNKQYIQDSILAAAGNYQGDSEKPHITLFANNIINKAHNQAQFNMLANALFLAAGVEEGTRIDYCEAVKESVTTKSITLKSNVAQWLEVSNYLWEVKNGNEWTTVGTEAKLVYSGLRAGRDYTIRLTVTDINNKTVTDTIVVRTRSDSDSSTTGTSSGSTGSTTTDNTATTTTTTNETVKLTSADASKSSVSVKLDSPESSKEPVSVSIPTQDLVTVNKANKDFVINIETSFCTYTLPASIVNTVANFNSLLNEAKVSAKDTTVKVSLQNTQSEIAKEGNEFKLSYEFKVELVNTKTGKAIGELNNFSQPISRTIYLPKEIKSLPEFFGVFRYDPETKTSAFVRHKASVENGKPAVTIVSKSNSTYVITAEKVTFTDVADTFWGKNLVDTAGTKGLVHGMGNGIFEPNKNVTRAEFTQMLINALDSGNGKYDNAPYSDVTSDKYYFQAVSKAKELGLIKFATDKFEPNSPISREEMASMLSAAVQLNTKPAEQHNTLNFNDVQSINPNYTNDVLTVTALNIMNGTGGNNFSPKDSTTRAQAAAVLVRMCNALGFIG